MTATHFSGPVVSAAGFVVGSSDTTSGVYGGGGTSAAPVSLGTTANQKMYANYATVAATTGDTRLVYDKLTFTGVGGSGETSRIYARVNNVTAATAGTVNGAHITLDVDGASGAISGAGNALRATLGGTAVTPGGTLSVIQVDSNLDTGMTVPTTASFLRFTNTGVGTLANLLNIPNVASGGIFAAHTTQTLTQSIRIITANGTKYYVMCTDAATNRTGGA